jgi:hypothetical protein
MAEVNFVRFARAVKDQAYVAVGFGVLGFQKAQTYRVAWERRHSGPGRSARAWYRPPPPPSAAERLAPLVQGVAGLAAQRLRPLVSDAAERMGPLVSDAANRVGPLVSDAAERMGPLVSETAEQLRPDAQEFLRAAGDLMNDLPGEARELAKEAVAFGRFAVQAFRPPPPRSQAG